MSDEFIISIKSINILKKIIRGNVWEEIGKGQLRDTIEQKIGKNTTVHITYVNIYISEEIDFLKKIIH